MNEKQAECLVHNTSILWTGLVDSGSVTEIAESAQRVCTALKNIELVPLAIRAANIAYNCRRAEDDPKVAVVEMIKADITKDTAAQATAAVYRCPLPLKLYDYCVLHRIAGRPAGKSDPNYLAASLVKGIKRKLAERENIDAYLKHLESKGLPKELLSALRIATMLTEGLPMGPDARGKFAAICKLKSMDLEIGEVVFNAVEEFYIGGQIYEYVFQTDE